MNKYQAEQVYRIMNSKEFQAQKIKKRLARERFMPGEALETELQRVNADYQLVANWFVFEDGSVYDLDKKKAFASLIDHDKGQALPTAVETALANNLEDIDYSPDTGMGYGEYLVSEFNKKGLECTLKSENLDPYGSMTSEQIFFADGSVYDLDRDEAYTSVEAYEDELEARAEAAHEQRTADFHAGDSGWIGPER